MALPKAGDQYRLNADFGVDAQVKAGTVVTVREVVKAATKGAHDDSEDAVVVEFDAPAVGYDDNDQPIIVNTLRAFSVSLEQFAADYTKEG